ncbi:hypothetical protein [Mycobacterium sp. DL592]|uniref:hypothetical protein n=1 Tax=Mycobacterium sp. DL592 TaxID=2675524 RepID=UPI00142130BC|nr:hypothetical protein [Mycobacterium sp. DL592]
MSTPLSDWISDADYEWRQRLAPVRLVIETDFTADEVREAQNNFGREAEHLVKQGWSHEKIIKRYPALTLVSLVGHAALAYDQGAYWQSFWEELGLSHDADFENEIRRQLSTLLDKFSLARFPDIEQGGGNKYVMTLALHAGIPIHCLRDLLDIITDHIVQGRPATGSGVMEWLQEPGKEYRATTLDVPVRNFLIHGAEFAADILDRIIEFIEAGTADPTLLGAELDSSTTGLPGVLLDELILQLMNTPLHLDKKQLSSRAATHPTISYSVQDDEVVLVLPAPSEEADKAWWVSFDGDVREVHAVRRWGSDSQAALARVAVPGPVREVVITQPAAAGTSLPLVLESDPLLIFDQAGRWIGRHDGLKDSAWAIYPNGYELVDTRTATKVDTQGTGHPAGWHGWSAVFVDLELVDALQLTHDGNPIGTPRRVRKDSRPRFVLGDEVAGLSTTEGRTVYCRRPWVLLPPSGADPAPVWNVRVRRFGESQWIVDESWRGEDVETCVDPFDEAEESQIGLFEVVVTGPMGADARCVVFLAEGVDTTFEPVIRIPESGGLTPCTATVQSVDLALSSPGAIAFDHRKTTADLVIRSADRSVDFVLTPPHIEIRSGETGMPVPWRMSADICDPEDFAEDRFVAIRAPGIDAVTFGYRPENGDLLQLDAHPRRRQGNVFETRTQQFADTVRSHPTGALVANLYTNAGVLAVAVLVARPRLLASGVELVDHDTLVFVDAADIDDLAAYVWSATAPWHAPDVIPLTAGRGRLPQHLVGRGELRCQLFVDDPWVYIERPASPPDTAFRVSQSGWRVDGTPKQRELARFLGGSGPVPVNVGAIHEVWVALTRLRADGRMKRFKELTVLLAEDPRRALECLGDGTTPAGDKMAAFVRSELVNHSFAAEQTHNELHAHPWFGCMVELADLPSLFHRRHKVRGERAETLAYLRERGGVPLMELLQTGKTVRFDDACFTPAVLELSSILGNSVDAKLAEIQQIPKAQLHPESLRAGVYEGLCHRKEWMAAGWSANFATQLDLVRNPIKKASLLAYETIALRLYRLSGVDVEEHPWMLMSVQSLTLALLARLEAHKRIGGQYLNRGLLDDWAHMSHLCPTMVANDILIAEALVLYDRRGDLTGEAE